MINNILILVFYLILSSNIFTQEVCAQSNQNKIRNEFEICKILNCNDDIVLIRDSFNYYFNKPDDLIYAQDGNIYFCGLYESNEYFTYEYFCFESDSTILIEKKNNVADSSFRISMLKREIIETVDGNERGCWKEGSVRIECFKNGVIQNLIFVNDDSIIEPKRIIFK